MNILHRAALIYDRALDAGIPFGVADLTESLVADLLEDEHDLTELVSLAADTAVRKVDKDRTNNRPDATLFDSLDQAVPVAGGMRVARRAMRMLDWTAHLEHVADNAARVNHSAAKENRRFSALAPYLSNGASTEDAIKAWQEAHPGELLP